MAKIVITRDTLRKFKNAINLEWIVTNGLGGYSSSTVLGINTRKYHGILVSSFDPPLNRRVMITKLDEQITDNKQTYLLGANEFSQSIFPRGYEHLEKFQWSLFPQFHYKIDNIELKKTILMLLNKNTTVVHYEVFSSLPKSTILKIFPLVNSRHFHSVTRRRELEPTYSKKVDSQRVRLQTTKPQSTLIISTDVGKFLDEDETWVEGMHFRIDRSLGTNYIDDSYIPGRFNIPINPQSKTEFTIVATAAREAMVTEDIHESSCREAENFEDFRHRQTERICNLMKRPPSLLQGNVESRAERYLMWLIWAADSFIVARASTQKKSVIAGYHWFEDWGRDTLISLPGLTLVTHRFDDARDILLTFKNYCHAGLMPNRFPDKNGQTPIYNTVDATLWYFNSVLQYLKYTGDFSFIKNKLWNTLKSVIDHHIQGTINNIHLDNDGLIEHGPQLTWMDAVINGNPVTPRHGKAVEIQALWFNALKTMIILANRFGYPNLADKYTDLAKDTSLSFVEKFWDDQRSCLLDVLNKETEEVGVRPNQIFAVSLDFSMLNKKQQFAVVSTVQTKLWTKCGLRTLSPDDKRYRGRYYGTWDDRNLAYHNGTIWPWLTGPFSTAFLRVHNFDAETRGFVFENFLLPLLEEQTHRAGLGTISEIFDGDAPHIPRGCVSQAWSVAELLRSYFEDICLVRGRFEKEILGCKV